MSRQLPPTVDSSAALADDVRIEPGAVIGPGVSIGTGASVGHGAVLVGRTDVGERSSVGAGVILDGGDGELGVRLHEAVSIGAGAVVASPLVIATGARVEPGAVVLRDVPPNAIVAGNPAQIVGYTDTSVAGTLTTEGVGSEPSVHATSVQGVTLHRLPKVLDLRGNLSVGEFERDVPFDVKRYFMVFGVPNAEIRGEHAHRTCHQFLIAAHGHLSVVADDGHQREEFLLDDPGLGLFLPALTWGIQYRYSPDAVLLVFASEFYDPAEYIRDYDEFREIVA